MNPPTPPQISPPLPRGRRPAPWLIALTILLLLIGGFVTWKRVTYNHWRWAAIVMPERMARVPARWNLHELALRLEKTHKVHEAGTFEEAGRALGLVRVEPGGYALPAKADPRELAALFNAGPTHLKITFPEGFTAAQMVTRLASDHFAGAAELRALAYPAMGFSPLEGRLFPDTYLLAQKANGKTLAGRLQERFLQTTNGLHRPFPRVAGKPLSLYQLVVLASLVEREAGSAQEMPLVAGVLLNRLNKPMRLQVDATVQYARVLASMAGGGDGEAGHKAVLALSDLKIGSPYNTYEINGLPPTPICNPGAAALRAAANPTPSNFLFYVYSPKLKRHRFATTFEEHRHNIALAKLERAALPLTP